MEARRRGARSVTFPGVPLLVREETSWMAAKPRDVIIDGDEEVCLEARRHGIVLAGPLLWAVVLSGVGGVVSTAPRPYSLAGAALIALGVFLALRAVWKWGTGPASS